MLCSREHKVITSDRKQNFLTIDELKVFKGTTTKYNKLKVYNYLYNNNNNNKL